MKPPFIPTPFALASKKWAMSRGVASPWSTAGRSVGLNRSEEVNMRTQTLVTVLLLCIFTMPVTVQAGQAKALPEVGFLGVVVGPDYDEAKDPNIAAFIDGLR